VFIFQSSSGVIVVVSFSARIVVMFQSPSFLRETRESDRRTLQSSRLPLVSRNVHRKLRMTSERVGGLAGHGEERRKGNRTRGRMQFSVHSRFLTFVRVDNLELFIAAPRDGQ
jgi:hypothetical protein